MFNHLAMLITAFILFQIKLLEEHQHQQLIKVI